MRKNVVFITNKKKQKPDTLKPWLPRKGNDAERDYRFMKIDAQN